MERLCENGLISKNTCMKAEELVHSVIAFQEIFRYSDVLNQNDLDQEAENHEYSEHP